MVYPILKKLHILQTVTSEPVDQRRHSSFEGPTDNNITSSGNGLAVDQRKQSSLDVQRPKAVSTHNMDDLNNLYLWCSVLEHIVNLTKVLEVRGQVSSTLPSSICKYQILLSFKRTSTSTKCSVFYTNYQVPTPTFLWNWWLRYYKTPPIYWFQMTMYFGDIAHGSIKLFKNAFFSETEFLKSGTTYRDV